MNGNCHFVYGASVATALSMNMDKLSTIIPTLVASPENITLFIFGGLIGGIFPDLDNPTSYVGKLSSPLSKLFGVLGTASGKTGANHRGILHDPLVYLVGLFLCCQHFTPLIGFFIGCLSHLFLDMFNPAGVPFLFGVKHLHLMKIPSGSRESVIFTWLNVVLVLVVGFVLQLNLFPLT